MELIKLIINVILFSGTKIDIDDSTHLSMENIQYKCQSEVWKSHPTIGLYFPYFIPTLFFLVLFLNSSLHYFVIIDTNSLLPITWKFTRMLIYLAAPKQEVVVIERDILKTCGKQFCYLWRKSWYFISIWLLALPILVFLNQKSQNVNG